MWRGVFIGGVIIASLFGLAPGFSSAQEAPEATLPLRAVGVEAFEALSRFFDYDATIPLQGRIVERKDRDLSVREKFVFRGVRGFIVPGYLERPKHRDGPVPLVLLLHGWSGSKDHWWREGGYISGGNLRTALLNEGFAVLALDAPTHGDRIAENNYGTVNNLIDDSMPNHMNAFTVNEIVIQGTRDYRRVLDYVASRDEIDSERIGMIGYSMGAWQTFILTAVETRIDVSVACAVPSLAGQSSPIAPKDYARGIGTRPVLMLMGSNDSMCHPTHARQLLNLIPGEQKELKMFDAGHKLPPTYVEDAVSWMEKFLK